jgi:hypothetical protein
MADRASRQAPGCSVRTPSTNKTTIPTNAMSIHFNTRGIFPPSLKKFVA